MTEINKSKSTPGYEAVTDYLNEQHTKSIIIPAVQTNDVFIPITMAADMVRDIGEKPELFLTIPNMACLIIVAGMGKVGKSLLLELLCLTLVSNSGVFMGKDAAKNLRVLFASYEEFFVNRSQRALKQFGGMDKEMLSILSKNYFVLNDGYYRYLSTDKQRQDFLSKVRAFAPDVLIIDSLSRIYIGSIENSSEALEIMRFLRSIAEICNIPVIVIHHTRKLAPGTPLTLDLMAGSRLVSSEADFVLGVGKGAGGTRYTKALACRYSNDDWDELPTFKINEFAMAEYTGSFKEEEILKSAMQTSSTQTNADKIERYIKMNCKATTAELQTAFVSSNQMARSTLFETIKKIDKINSISKGLWVHTDCQNHSSLNQAIDDFEEE